MRGTRVLLAATVLACSTGCAEQPPRDEETRSATSSAAPSSSVTPAPDDATSYAWLDDSTPSDTYTVAMVRGLSAAETLRALGTVDQEVGPTTGAAVLDLPIDLMDPESYASPPIVQVDELGEGVFVFSPSGFRPYERIAALSAKGVAAAFTTTVELDTSVHVARDGKLLREFDPFFYDEQERRGALPEETGIGLGRDDTFAPSWTLLDRLTSMHVDEHWFNDTSHPTYVLTEE